MRGRGRIPHPVQAVIAALRTNPTLRGILYDQEHVLAHRRLAELGADDR